MAQTKKTEVEASNGFASQFADSEFRDVALSRPTFKPASGDVLHGLMLGVAGPFPPAKGSTGDRAKPWGAFVFKVIAPTKCTDVDGKEIVAAPGTEVMMAITAQTKNMLQLAVDRTTAHEVKIKPGPQPAAGKMRTFEVKRGKQIARGNDYPVLLPTTGAATLLLSAGAQEDGGGSAGQDEIPF